MQSRTALVGAVVLAAALVTAGVAGVVTAGGQSAAEDVQSQTQTQSDGRTIQTAAVGQVETAADRAVVRLAVVSAGDDVGTVREDLAANASSMRQALTDAGIAEDQIRTAHFDISSDRRYGGHEENEPKYRAVHAFSVTVDDTDRVGEVIDAAVSNGASEVDGVEFTLSPDRRSDLKQEALADAMDSARGKADAVAQSADLQVAGVHTIETSDFSSRPYRVEAAAAGDGGGGTSIDSGPVTVTASVSVVYEVADA
jgi:uncharacterized protein YggE